MTDKANAQIEGLATLLVLNDEIRKVANMREFGFFTTNETHRLIPFHVSYLWVKREHFGIELIAQSGTPELDIHSITNQWLKRKISLVANSPQRDKIHQFNLIELEKDNPEPELGVDWTETFPHFVLWCPLFSKSQELNGGIIFLRETAFSDHEIKMLNWLLASYQYTWELLIKPKRTAILSIFKKKPVIFAIIAILLFPIHLSVLGTATVVPKNPVLINSPIEGVIKSFAVSPSQHVKAGQLLFTLDKSELESNAEVTRKELLLTQAKLRTAINQGMDNAEIGAEVPILKAQLAIDNAHIEYTNELLSKTNVTSPIAGIVIFDSKEDWIGQPVRTGERILMVTDPTQVQLKITLPITNIISLTVGNEGDFFKFGDLRSIPVTIKTLGYNAKLMPNKILSYELQADFNDTENLPQLGAQGTVRLYGSRVPLIFYLLRRPIEVIRQSFGI